MTLSITPTTWPSQTSTLHAGQAPRPADAGPFTRSPPMDPKVDRRPAAGHRAVPATQVDPAPRFNRAQMQAMGAEILDLYRKKIVNRNERYLNFSSEGKTYKISAYDIRNVLIHADEGIVQLGADGTPWSHPYVRIGRDDMTLALMRTLATLRHYTPDPGRHA